MATNPKDITARKLIGKFARTLLAGTCLTAATGGAALAGSITYGPATSPSTNDAFTFSPTAAFPAATTPGVTILNFTQDGQETEFDITGLGSGAFTLSATTNDEAGDFISVYGGPGFTNFIAEGGFTGGSPFNIGATAIPGSGELVISTEPNDESSNSFTVTVTTSAPSGVPEPSTVGLVGLGLAGALTLSRKRRKQ